MTTYLHHLDQDNDRARRMDEEFERECYLRDPEQLKRMTFCRYLISKGKLTDELAPFWRVTRHPKDNEEKG